MGETEKVRFARARAELKEDLELYRLLNAYEDPGPLEELDGLARMALAAVADSAAEYLKAGAAAGYSEEEANPVPGAVSGSPNAADLLVPATPEPALRPPRPASPPATGSMSTEDLMRLVEADADLSKKS